VTNALVLVGHHAGLWHQPAQSRGSAMDLLIIYPGTAARKNWCRAVMEELRLARMKKVNLEMVNACRPLNLFSVQKWIQLGSFLSWCRGPWPGDYVFVPASAISLLRRPNPLFSSSSRPKSVRPMLPGQKAYPRKKGCGARADYSIRRHWFSLSSANGSRFFFQEIRVSIFSRQPRR